MPSGMPQVNEHQCAFRCWISKLSFTTGSYAVLGRKCRAAVCDDHCGSYSGATIWSLRMVPSDWGITQPAKGSGHMVILFKSVVEV